MNKKNIKIILGIVGLLLFMIAHFMPDYNGWRPIVAIVLSTGILLQIGLIVLIARNHN